MTGLPILRYRMGISGLLNGSVLVGTWSTQAPLILTGLNEFSNGFLIPIGDSLLLAAHK